MSLAEWRDLLHRLASKLRDDRAQRFGFSQTLHALSLPNPARFWGSVARPGSCIGYTSEAYQP